MKRFLLVAVLSLAACKVTCGQVKSPPPSSNIPAEWAERDGERARESEGLREAWGSKGAGPSVPAPISPGPAIGAAAAGLVVGGAAIGAAVGTIRDAGPAPPGDEH